MSAYFSCDFFVCQKEFHPDIFCFWNVIADEIDLLNVSFDGLSAPDRISARAGLKELQKIAPLRRSAFISTYFSHL